MYVLKYYIKRLQPFFVLFAFACMMSFLCKLVSVWDKADVGLAALALMGLEWVRQSGTVFLYMAVGISLYLTLLPRRWHGGSLDSRFTAVLFFGFAWVLFFSKLAEALFWNEFGVSFNFIAVDYLVYTQEVLGNIDESYPVGLIVASITLAAGCAVLLLNMWRQGQELIWPLLPKLSVRLAVSAGLAAACLLTYVAFDADTNNAVSANRYNREIAKNEMYSFFSAFMNNRLDYEEFYITAEAAKNLKLLRGEYAAPNVTFTSPDSLKRTVQAAGEAQELNVMLVVMESLGSEFMNENEPAGGDLTPNLTALSKQGLYFPNTYAVGTRTVRGLEAVTLALPPQTGMSVIRQPDNGGLSNVGDIFCQRGYDVKWVYGGYGYFDNMNEFFGGNGFTVIDRTDIDDKDIHHETVWGVADEDLFSRALAEGDKSYDSGKKFFQLVMTTSNHRPFTYPEGRIDLPPKVSGRDGAVKYADWAVGDFVERAKSKPWFKDTVFIFIADHGASSAGKKELNPEKHQIPFIVYAPSHIAPQRVEKTISQIDALPTVLGLLNFSYEASFMGRDALTAPDDGRYFISNYQYIGYGEQDKLLVLRPVRESVYYEAGDIKAQPPQGMLDRAVAYYQYAADWANILRDNK